jgi:hypothetical protein
MLLKVFFYGSSPKELMILKKVSGACTPLAHSSERNKKIWQED